MFPRFKLALVAALALTSSVAAFAAPKKVTVEGKKYFKGIIHRRALNDKAVTVRKTLNVDVKHATGAKQAVKGRRFAPGKNKAKRRFANNARTVRELKIIKIKASDLKKASKK